MKNIHAVEYGPSYWYAGLTAVLHDRVVQALLIGIGLLGVVDTPQVWPSVQFTAQAFWGMLPFFLIALSMAAYTRAAGADEVIAGLFAGKPVVAIISAAVFGAVSPFCSCGVIPIIAALLVARVPLAPVMAFWIASPIMDPEMFILTAAGIGSGFAIAKTLAAMAMGLLAGFTVMLLSASGLFDQPMKVAASAHCGSSCRAEKPSIRWQFWHDPDRNEVFFSEFIKSGLFLGKWLAMAFFIESIMLAYLSPEQVASVVGGNSWLVIPLAALIGVPAYLNGYAAIPLVSGLIDLGMSPGAALAFITAGAVSSIPAAMAVYALVRTPVFITYLLLGFVGSIAAGSLYQLFVLF